MEPVGKLQNQIAPPLQSASDLICCRAVMQARILGSLRRWDSPYSACMEVSYAMWGVERDEITCVAPRVD